MGAETSRERSSGATGKMRRLSTKFHKHLVAGWQQRHLRTQFFAVVRHTERADSWSAVVNGERWIKTEDFRRWGPMDPPLSDDGLVAAGVVGKRLRMSADDSGCDLHVVVTSPYFRCVQTAVEICRELGDGARILLDNSLGEIYGPAVMGPDEPAGSTRPTELLVDYCRARGVNCPQQGVGHHPTWPEGLDQARLRFAGRFLEYVHRSTKAQRNFVIVSHADCVGAALRLMPSHATQVVQRAEFGAMFVAQRSTLAHPPGMSPGGSEDIEPPFGSGEGALPPPVSEGWNVQTFDLWLRRKSQRNYAIKDNLRALAHGSRMSEERVAQLLGELADEPLEESDGGAGASSCELHREGFMRGGSRISVSTFLFGSSDVGNLEDIPYSRTTTMDRSEELLTGSSSLHGPAIMRNSRLTARGTGSFENLDWQSCGDGNPNHPPEGVGRSYCRQNSAPSPVAEEDCQPQDGEVYSPPARPKKGAHSPRSMAGSRLFQRRFAGKVGMGVEKEGTVGPVLATASEGSQVVVGGCCGPPRATKPEVELHVPGKSALLQRRAGQGLPAKHVVRVQL